MEVSRQDLDLLIAFNRSAVQRASARVLAAIRPVQDARLRFNLEVDGLGELLKHDLDIRSVRGILASGKVNVGAEDAARVALGRALLGPVELALLEVDGDADAPVHEIGDAAGVLHKHLVLGPVDVAAVHGASLAVAEVELFGVGLGVLDEDELLGGGQDAVREKNLLVAAVEGGGHQRAVLGRHVGAHVGPVHPVGGGVDVDAVGGGEAGDDGLGGLVGCVEAEDLAVGGDAGEGRVGGGVGAETDVEDKDGGHGRGGTSGGGVERSVGGYRVRRVETALLRGLETELALGDVVAAEPVDRQGAVELALVDVVVLDEGDGVETDAVHQLAGEDGGLEHVSPEGVDLGGIGHLLGENGEDLTLDGGPETVEDEAEVASVSNGSNKVISRPICHVLGDGIQVEQSPRMGTQKDLPSRLLPRRRRKHTALPQHVAQEREDLLMGIPIRHQLHRPDGGRHGIMHVAHQLPSLVADLVQHQGRLETARVGAQDAVLGRILVQLSKGVDLELDLLGNGLDDEPSILHGRLDVF